MSYSNFKVAGYLRLSKEDEDREAGDKDQSDSIVSQKSIIENKVKELGNDFELYDLYIDDGYTGLNTDRPSFKRMIKDIENGVINTVITKDLSRLSRNSFEANYYIEIFFLERNIRYISILDNIDTYIKNSNNDMLQFKTLINDWYSKDISKKVRSGVWARKEKGLFMSAKAPYGYLKDKNNKNHLVPDPECKEIVKMIFELYDKGNNTMKIAEQLKQQKIYCPSHYDYGGARNGDYNWNPSVVARILRNKVYLGHTEFGKKLSLSYKSKKIKYVPRDEWHIVKNTHEPIIPKELFDRVQEKLDVYKITKKKDYTWMLNGIIFCKECGTKMSVKAVKNKDGSLKFLNLLCGQVVRRDVKTSCPRAHKGINETIVNQIVISSINKKIKKALNNKKLNELISKEYNKAGTKAIDDNIEILNKQLSKVEKTIASLYEDYKNELIEVEDYKKFYSLEVIKRNELKKQINDLITKKENRPVLSTEKIISILNNLSNVENWSKEKMLELINNIEIDKDNNIYINYKYNVLDKI